jgi:hypothetical protein
MNTIRLFALVQIRFAPVEIASEVRPKAVRVVAQTR